MVDRFISKYILCISQPFNHLLTTKPNHFVYRPQQQSNGISANHHKTYQNCPDSTTISIDISNFKGRQTTKTMHSSGHLKDSGDADQTRSVSK